MLLTMPTPSWAQLRPADDAYPWRWSNPSQHGANILDVVAADDASWGVQLGGQGQIFLTQDWAEWEPLDIEEGFDLSLRSGFVFQGQLMITTEGGGILSTVDFNNFDFQNISDPDWLESGAASDTLAVVVGDNGAIFTSSDGINWGRQTSPSNAWLRGVTFGNGTWVAVGEDGTILSSVDGTTWSLRVSGVSAHLNQVFYTGTDFFAVGASGTLLTSSDGGAWTPVSSGATGDLWTGGAWGNRIWVAGSSELRIRFLNGIWVDQINDLALSPASNWTYYAGVDVGDQLFVGGRTGVWSVGQLSGLSMSWTEPNASTLDWIWEIEAVGDVVYAVGDRGLILSSTDGSTWEAEITPEAVADQLLLGLGGANDGLMVAVGGQGVLLVSQNGVEWTSVVSPAGTADLQGVAVFQDRLYVSGSDGAFISTDALGDGTVWSLGSLPTTAFVSGLAASSDRLVASGSAGTLLSSSDGVTWQAHETGLSDWLFRARWDGSQFWVVGQNGVALKSSDGMNWTSVDLGTTTWVNDIIQIPGVGFLTVGSSGYTGSSADGISWETRSVITGKSLYSGTIFDQQALVAGIDGVVLRSRIPSESDQVSVVNYSRIEGVDLMLLDAPLGMRFTADSGDNLTDWTPGPVLEILKPLEPALFQASGLSGNAGFYKFQSELPGVTVSQ